MQCRLNSMVKWHFEDSANVQELFFFPKSSELVQDDYKTNERSARHNENDGILHCIVGLKDYVLDIFL